MMECSVLLVPGVVVTEVSLSTIKEQRYGHSITEQCIIDYESTSYWSITVQICLTVFHPPLCTNSLSSSTSLLRNFHLFIRWSILPILTVSLLAFDVYSCGSMVGRWVLFACDIKVNGLESVI
jgi:hypothetical protein